jgi:hypothetical protein
MSRISRVSLVVAASVALCSAGASAQVRALSIRWSTGEANPSRAIIGLDADDDDDDGVPDMLSAVMPSVSRDDDQAAVSIELDARGPLRVETHGGVRVIDAGGLLSANAEFSVAQRHTVRLVGVATSERADDARVVFVSGSVAAAVNVTVAAVVLLRGDNSIVWPHRDAVSVAHSVTNDDSLPRGLQWSARSGDPDDVRVELWDPGGPIAPTARLDAIVQHAAGILSVGSRRSTLRSLPLARDVDRSPFRSRFVRLVGDLTDAAAPGVQGQTLLVGLRDRVRASYQRPGVAGEAAFDVRVGRPGNEDGPLAARRARWRLITLRATPGGHPVIGNDDDGASALLREQVTISNEIYLQCGITFGASSSYPVLIADPPRNSLLSVSDDVGLRAAGGEINLRVAGRSIGPIATRAGWTPLETAEAIGRAIVRAGLVARVTANRRTDYASEGSADVQARDAQGRWVAFEPVANVPMTTDRRQRLALGVVDLSDGLEEFQNMNSASGTLEERTLMKSLTDDDPTTIELVVVNRFTRATRIGEAFVEGDGGSILNALFLDRAGLSAQREAWTQSHEVGHILLDQPWHPDNLGPDRPWLLMDADASLAAVNGPKRLTLAECARIRAESGPLAVPSLLQRFDEARPSPRAAEFAQWPQRAPYARPAGVSSTSTAATPPRVERDRATDWGVSIER